MVGENFKRLNRGKSKRIEELENKLQMAKIKWTAYTNRHNEENHTFYGQIEIEREISQLEFELDCEKHSSRT